MRDQNEGEVGKRKVREMLARPCLSSGGVSCPGLDLLLATEAAKAEKAVGDGAPGWLICRACNS